LTCAGYFFSMSFYRRRLPHWDREGVPIFLTWRLYGSLPRSLWEGRSETCPTAGKKFLLMDRQLDAAGFGPTYLKDPRVAAAVVEALLVGEREWKLYELFAWVIMSNHVHVLLQPHRPLRQVTRAVKNASARKANLILGRTGLRFWQDESYDHWVRDGKEFERIVQYIEWNPVRVGLGESVEQWPWSSAGKEWQVGDLPHVRLHSCSQH
jgi:putative transposase